MKSFSQIAEAVNPATNTPFERAVRAAHPVVIVDVPREMSGDNVVKDMPKDKSRPADNQCECGEPNCDCDEYTDIHESQILDEQYKKYGSVGHMINEIATAWINLDVKNIDPVALEVLREDIEAIRDYILDEEDVDTGSPTDVSFSPPAGKLKRSRYEEDEDDEVETAVAPIRSKPVAAPGKYDKDGIALKPYNVFEQFMPGKFQLKDGAEISLNDADASLLNKLRGHLSPANVKSLEERVKKNFQSFSEVLEFARTTLDGDDKSK